MVNTRKLITATLLGVVIAVVKSPFQWPITDYLIIVEAPILGLSFLMLGRGGATYTGLINGVLQSVFKGTPLDLLFGVFYGALVDMTGTGFGVGKGEGTNSKRMAAALGLASTIAGLSIAFVVITLNISLGPLVSGLGFSDLVNIVYVPIIVWGIISGVLGGYISAKLWDRNLKARFKSMQPPVG